MFLKNIDMNKKLIINENLNWPVLEENESKIILELIESNFKAYQSTIKRKKTPPKYLRLKKDTVVESIKPIKLENNESGILLKQRFRLGINAVTKTLETEPNIVKFVLVCRSCAPLKLLTRHLHIMCAQLSIPAGCINNLSGSLAKFLNIKSVSAFALCDESLVKTNEKMTHLDEVANGVSILVNQISEKIRKHLKALDNPLSSKIGLSKELIENTRTLKLEELLDESESNMKEIEMVDSKIQNSPGAEKCEEFGSDFISFDLKKSNEDISFNSPNFIQFNDDYGNVESTIEVEDSEFKKFPHFDRNKKRKLNAPIQKSINRKKTKNSSNFKFNKLKLINKKENNNNRKKK
jgi:hypothetical protein